MSNEQLIQPYMGLQNLIETLNRLEQSKIDFVADSRQLNVARWNDGNELVLRPGSVQVAEFLPRDGLPLKRHALSQLTNRTSPTIPIQFFERLYDELPGDAVQLLNNCKDHSQKRFLIRCLDDNVRAILSDSYRVIDNLDIAFGALKAVKEAGGEVLYASLSESHMRISFTNRNLVEQCLWEERKHGRGSHKFINAIDVKGDDGESLIHPVVTVSNSETGQGTTNVWYGIFRSYCVNTMLTTQAQKEVHLGGKLDEGIFSADTQQKRAAATMAELRDAIHAGLNNDVFQKIIGQVKQSVDVEVQAPTAAVGNIAKEFGISEDQQSSILEHFLSDYDRNAYGLSQAISRAAQDLEDPNRADEYQKLAGQVMTGSVNQLIAA